MDFPVIYQGRAIGNCSLKQQGLYWQLECSCRLQSDRVERLYCGKRRLAVLEQDGEYLRCSRRISRASAPELPPPGGVFSLSPQAAAQIWQGQVLGYSLSGFRDGETLLFPYDLDEPCPCEPLICFFTIADGFWKLKLLPKWDVRSLQSLSGRPDSD